MRAVPVCHFLLICQVVAVAVALHHSVGTQPVIEIYHTAAVNDNLRTREDQEITAPERAESITPLEHFSAFYQLQNNQPLTAEQAAFCQQLI